MSTAVLMPIEFKDCLTDSPEFRRKLQSHEKELDRTSQAIKSLTKEIKSLVDAARNLSIAQKNFMCRLQSFAQDPNKSNLTEDEIVISRSFNAFAQIIKLVEEERQRMLDRAEAQIIGPLEAFRKDAIGGAKERRKKFEKQTQKFYQSQDRYLNLSTKKDDQVLQEADASLDMEQRHFVQASLEYVFLLQEVQERKKFEFVEIILSHTYSWLTFYHQGHDVYNDYTNFMTDLQERIQRTRENFNATRQEAFLLKNKMLEIQDPGSMDKVFTRQGYLFLMEKKAFGTTTWTKFYCSYQKETGEFKMISYNQIQQKLEMILRSCVRRSSDSIDKRFCLDLTVQMIDKDKVPQIQVITVQALSEDDCKRWMNAMDGKEPVYISPGIGSVTSQETTMLDDRGLSFIMRAIAVLESRGLEDQGLYRLVGVASKVNKLLSLGLDPQKSEKLSIEDTSEWEVKTITSAVKQYFRNLPQPLMTYRLHCDFILAAKKEKMSLRVNCIHYLIHNLPNTNFKVLKTLMQHLCNVAKKSSKNLMTVSNLGVCFGPTLLRPEEESVAAIMDIKFCNIVVEILIEYFDKIFNSLPSSSVEVGCAEGALKQGCFTPPTAPSASSTPKSSPTPTSHSPSGSLNQMSPNLPHVVASKVSQPVLQTVVTSFTTSEPQTVHFGNQPPLPSHPHPHPYLPQQQSLMRSDATSNLKTGIGAHMSHPSNSPYHGYRPPVSGIPPPPSALHAWPHAVHSASSSSLTSAIGSVHDLRCGSSNSSNFPRPSRFSGSHNGKIGGPLSFINPLSESERGDCIGSSGSSCESLCSGSSRPDLPLSGSVATNATQASSPPTNVRLGTAYPPTYRQHMETKRVRTLYACVGENESELSFEPNQILTNVRPSKEPGWLEGTLNGRSGLVPENYVELFDDKGSSTPALIPSHRNTDV